MGKSRRHHYIPQFLTGHFATDDKLFTYDKKEDKYFVGSPINLFLKRDRNTFLDKDGLEDDVIEQMYASVDELFSSILTVITKSNVISDESYKMLLLLAYITKWRVPQYDESFQNAKDHFSVDDLGLGLNGEDNERISVDLEELFNLDMHQEMKRLLLALQPFRFKEDFKKLIENSFIICTPLDAFISDCPFNEAAIISDEIFEDFVFPITKELTLVYCTRIDRNEVQYFLQNGDQDKVSVFLREFSTARDISTLHLAERLVGCSNGEYLKFIVNTHKAFNARGAESQFSLTVFNVLYRFNEYAST